MKSVTQVQGDRSISLLGISKTIGRSCDLLLLRYMVLMSQVSPIYLITLTIFQMLVFTLLFALIYLAGISMTITTYNSTPGFINMTQNEKILGEIDCLF